MTTVDGNGKIIYDPKTGKPDTKVKGDTVTGDETQGGNVTTTPASIPGGDVTTSSVVLDEINENANTVTGVEALGGGEINVLPNVSNNKAIQKVVEELKAKYYVESSGDKYSMENPQVQSLQKFIQDGEMAKIVNSFSRQGVVEIISQVFPEVGVELNENGSFTLPKGHGDEAKEVFNSLLEQINQANVSSPEVERLKGLIAEDSQKLIGNLNKIKTLAAEIEQLKVTIETEVAEAIAAVKNAEESSKEEAKAAYKEELDNYLKKDPRDKEDYNEFEKSVHSRLKGINPNIDSAVRNMHNAERHMKEIKGLQADIKALNDENALLKANIDKNAAALVCEQAKANAEAEKNVDLCDPIGFKNAEGVQFDFFVDSDNNGELTDTNEFLGAKNGWAEMSAQDANGDGKVDVSELQNAGVKVVVTGTDGVQEIKDIADVLGKNDFIDLNSYKAENTDLGNGNIKAGSFNLNMNGQKIEGYQTLDTLDYLKENYEFTNEDLGKSEFGQALNTNIDPSTEAMTLYANEIKAESFDSMISNLEAKITEGWKVVLGDHDGEIAKVMREIRSEMNDKCPDDPNQGTPKPEPTPTPNPTPTPDPDPNPNPNPNPPGGGDDPITPPGGDDDPVTPPGGGDDEPQPNPEDPAVPIDPASIKRK